VSRLDDTEAFFTAPLHEGLNEPPEGKFASRWPTQGDGSRAFQLRRSIRRLKVAVVLLWLLVVGALFVIAYRW
jgi:hypothetical protein